MLKYIFNIVIISLVLYSCSADGNYPGLEYAPNMYHSQAYEPLSQITDETAGLWVSSIDDGIGEYYNSNPYNPFNMNMRVPPEHTVRRNPLEVTPYRIPKDTLGSIANLDSAARVLTNPVDSTDQILQQGQALYAVYCAQCHGGAGKGDGPVGQRYQGVPNYSVGRYQSMTAGHIFHVITHGQGRMGPQESMIDIIDRWKIVRYVQTLQNQPN
jgi:mono/diheme cytochrome c family protein